MANEKMKILKMLEEGKINADEAAKLIAASGSADDGGQGSYRGSERKSSTESYRQPDGVNRQQTGGSYSQPSDSRPRQSAGGQQTGGGYRQPTGSSGSRSGHDWGRSNRQYSGAGKSPDTFVDDLGRKLDVLFKDLEPTFQKISGAVVEKTTQVADKISRSFERGYDSSPPPTIQGGPRPYTPSPSSHGGYERNFELKVGEGYNELSVSTLNAPVLLKGYNGDNISAKVLAVPKSGSPRIELVRLGNKYYLDYNEADFEKVSIDAFIPENMFKSIHLAAQNGDVRISTVGSEFISLYTTNGSVEVSDINAVNMKIESERGREIRLNNVVAENGQIENFNGNIISYGVDVANLKMAALNGELSLNMASFSRFDNYAWIVEANNQRLDTILPSGFDVAYHIKAQTSLGEIRMGLTGLNYLSNERGFVEAKSIDYDKIQQKVRINFVASNAQLNIN